MAKLTPMKAIRRNVWNAVADRLRKSGSAPLKHALFTSTEWGTDQRAKKIPPKMIQFEKP